MTHTSRRTLLGASASAVVLAPLAWAFPADASAPRLYRRRRFKPLVRRSFRLTSKAGAWPVQLTAVTNLPRTAHGHQRRFALTFTSRTAGPPQGSYVLRRRGFQSTTLFVVPSDVTRRTYQAIIN
ncbi:DUF6916 family protein [Nocardioides lijunqiniae]|uniref:DUF6916 family protein n=1 Tax=Nocardioides lijunqiniae TaxID=2760832 RepID=UPI0018779CBB|nr:hypothetical protein [Nocardioides lijunqiniae]